MHPGNKFWSHSLLISDALGMPLGPNFRSTFVNSESVFAGLDTPCGDFIRDLCQKYQVCCTTPKSLRADFILSTSGHTAPDVAALGCIPGQNEIHHAMSFHLPSVGEDTWFASKDFPTMHRRFGKTVCFTIVSLHFERSACTLMRFV